MTSTKSRSYFLGGVLLCLTGAVCFSTKAIFVKLAYRETSVDAVSLLALRMIFSVPFFVASALLSSGQRSNVRFTPKQWLMVALIGFLGYYTSSLFDFIGLQYISAGIERLILFIYPTLVLLISSLVFKVKIKPVQWLALVITYTGLVLAFVSEDIFSERANRNFLFGSLMIFACTFTYACYFVGSGRLIPVVGPAKFNSYAMSFASVAVVIHFLLVNNNSLFSFQPRVYLYSVLMALVSTVIPSYMMAEGIKRIGTDNSAIVASIGPVSTIVQAYFFLQEQINLLQIVGTAFILTGVLIIGKKGNK